MPVIIIWHNLASVRAIPLQSPQEATHFNTLERLNDYSVLHVLIKYGDKEQSWVRVIIC